MGLYVIRASGVQQNSSFRSNKQSAFNGYGTFFPVIHTHDVNIFFTPEKSLASFDYLYTLLVLLLHVQNKSDLDKGRVVSTGFYDNNALDVPVSSCYG